MPGMYGCLGRVYIGLHRFTQNGGISAFRCRAEVLRSAFRRCLGFCVAFCGVYGYLGNEVCRNCGKVFERAFGRQVFATRSAGGRR